MKCPTCKSEAEHISHEPPEAHLQVGIIIHWCPNCGTMCKAWDLEDKIVKGSIKVPKRAIKKEKKPDRLSIGMRAKCKPNVNGNGIWSEFIDHECLLEERSSNGDFSVMILGQGDAGRTLKKKDPNTIVNQVAWISEAELSWVDSDLKKNIGFIDWYSENKENFCADCGAWFPDNGKIDPKTNDDYLCPNENCTGRLYDAGICPECKIPAVDNKCPKCNFDWDSWL